MPPYAWGMDIQSDNFVDIGAWLDWEPSEDFDHPETPVPQAIPVPENELDLSEPDVQWAMIRVSPAYFAQEILTGPPEPPYDGRFLVSEHHEEWDDLVTEHERLCVLAPRDHSKTFFFDFAIPLWKAVTMPNGIGFIFSATKEQASRILGDIKTEIENNPKLKWLMPSQQQRRFGNKWSDSQIRLSNGHRIYARGFGTKVRGAHPHYIIVDDGLNDETAYSELVRRKQTDYFYTAITNMIVPGGQIIVVGTPFHSEDLYADLESNDGYFFKRYQAINEETNEALWPDRYDRKRLLARQVEIGSIRFAREFQCVPISDEMSLFPLYLFQGAQEMPTVRLGMPLDFWLEAGVTNICIGVDFAMSSNVRADYTVIWTMGSDRAGNRWIIDIDRQHGLAYQQQLSCILQNARRYDPGLVYLESNQMQRIFGDELIRTTDIPIKKFITSAQNKHALDKGVPSLRVLLENGKFRIPRGDERSIELTNIWINEMRSFTWVDGKLESVSGHDDCAMACWITDQAIRQGGFHYSFGEDSDVDRDALEAELIGGDDEQEADLSFAV